MSNGYDGSMMNGLQTLENWREYFDNPEGGLLGLFNAIQVSPARLLTSRTRLGYGLTLLEYWYRRCPSLCPLVQRPSWTSMDPVHWQLQ